MVDITLGRYRIEVPSTGGIAIELHTNVIKDRVDEGDRGVQNLDLVSNSDTPHYRALRFADRFRLEFIERRRRFLKPEVIVP
jgi:hypothetical protein